MRATGKRSSRPGQGGSTAGGDRRRQTDGSNALRQARVDALALDALAGVLRLAARTDVGLFQRGVADVRRALRP